MTLIKRMTYRGVATEEWSNKYFFTGSTPADSTAWLALFTALTAQEKTLYDSNHKIIRGYGYSSDADDAVAVWSRDLTTGGLSIISGTLSGTTVMRPGDAAAWIRWKTSRLSVKGKPIYLRKYYHGIWTEQASPTAAQADNILAAQLTAYDAFGLKMRDASFLDARTLTAAGHSDTLVGHNYSSYVTTRTLKRRGKRPGT